MSLNHPITDWKGRTVWVLGASTGIGAALGRALDEKGAHLIASGRHLNTLESAFPNPRVKKVVLDITDPQGVARALDGLTRDGCLPDCVIWVAGDYSPQPITAPRGFDPVRARQVLETNLVCIYDGLAAILSHWLPLSPRAPAAPPFHICLFSSVAGYRGLPKALAYSASKAGLNALAETAHVELKPLGVDVSIVCPGFVKTRLTDGNDFEMPALITAEQAARFTFKGLARGEFEVHYPKRFSLFMKLLGLLPAAIYLRLIAKVRA
ncbi:MAG: SDR family NAD(P)-dependent oxidoreductase [Betaproteobacteria bacterium]|nr:SDR family NAD(P)-dependent oxidoreductase [Betaproteobacteria bacterium]NBT74961.1 SDR family NAD(P)-dependent oxidoreductase [Betaproteobacteria bacterium]NBY14251.1 SDR family NAD(P)-dependent oxidoreductase [Betaproteobacteria bacterium]NCA15692.1 SDR family NAD(P)-dependent oxidoreductase [Betaproteobacteria bacterium]